jgi:hypothetical protein
MFLWILKNSKFCSKSISFIKKYYFAVKTDQNSVFLGHKYHILDQLHIMVPYISFYGF